MQALFKNRLRHSAEDVVLQSDYEVAYRFEAEAVFQKLAKQQQNLFSIGKTPWGFPVNIPLAKLMTHGLILGATGAGKSYAALLLLVHSLKQIKTGTFAPMGFIDPKGELAQKANSYIQSFALGLDEKQQEEFYSKICVIDFSRIDKITPYNILYCQDQSKELLINNRIETISEINTGGSTLTPRMRLTLKYCLTLLVENDLPITLFEKVFFNNSILKILANKSKDRDLKHYFLQRFDSELKSTLYGLRQRIDSLFVSQGVKLSLSGKTAPDFRKLQDEGYFIVVNLAGPEINRSTTDFLLHIIISDIKQSVFQRQTKDKPYLFFIDEAQNLYKNKAAAESMNDLLTMARSFSSYFVLMCQSLSSSVRDNDILNSILANIRWMLMFRSTPRDAGLISPAMPLFGKPPNSHTASVISQTLSREQELKLRLAEISHFPDQQGYLWLKSDFTKALKLITKGLLPPWQLAGLSQLQFEDYLKTDYPNSNLVSPDTIVKHLEKLIMELEGEDKAAEVRDNKSKAVGNSLMEILEQAYIKGKGRSP
jgi:hypothetical protein